ncbi:hypothetical protein BDQ17DRAFT_1538631 [Cyathus striatus]|nr:hypothetical protein BDQ17DRAFT_1551320 [Cyathus striatus]KAF9010104.1 hypothetical protein BDQ17DRAFT_1538631 [Cyathus striatus]
MASGFGFSSGVPKCFVYWQEFSKCYAQADEPSQCRAQSDDYLECLHHTKETMRARVIQHQLNRQAEQAAKEGKKASEIHTGVASSVGLIERSSDESK